MIKPKQFLLDVEEGVQVSVDSDVQGLSILQTGLLKREYIVQRIVGSSVKRIIIGPVSDMGLEEATKLARKIEKEMFEGPSTFELRVKNNETGKIERYLAHNKKEINLKKRREETKKHLAASPGFFVNIYPSEFAGIYFLIQQDEIVYIGQTINLSGRVASHINNPEMVFSEIRFIPFARCDLNEAEAYYIQAFLPRYNKMIPCHWVRKPKPLRNK